MKAIEKGRKLVVSFGEDDDVLEYVVAPVNITAGAALLADFLQLFTPAGEDGTVSDELADTLADRALGTETNERAQLELRAEEYKFLAFSAFFWNVTGGGAAAMEAYHSGGLPKAVVVVFAAAGLQQTPPSTTSRSSESENPTL